MPPCFCWMLLKGSWNYVRGTVFIINLFIRLFVFAVNSVIIRKYVHFVVLVVVVIVDVFKLLLQIVLIFYLFV